MLPRSRPENKAVLTGWILHKGGRLQLNDKPKPTLHGAVSSKHYERDHDHRYCSNHGENAWHAHHNQGDIGRGDMHPHVKEPTTPALMPERRSETEAYAYHPPLVHPTGDNILPITRELFNLNRQ
jgi:hypothetical protein